MKNLILLLALLSIGMMSCKKKGCTDSAAVNYSDEAKKDDESCLYVPSISLNGSSSQNVPVGSTYIDLGATATDADGSSVTVITDISQVNTAALGTYTVTYTATNANGTATATRTLNVVIDQSNWVGSPSCSDDCNLVLFPLSGSPTVSAGATSSDIIIDNMFDIEGGTINCTINGSTITVPLQTVPIVLGSIILSGSGTMNASGTQYTINYSYDNTTPLIGGVGSCTGTYDI
ncbi:MAG: hypothetical protein ACI837_001142 [Crocinitomicaceae bacterium]